MRLSYEWNRRPKIEGGLEMLSCPLFSSFFIFFFFILRFKKWREGFGGYPWMDLGEVGGA